jgi:hypothetical protein
VTYEETALVSADPHYKFTSQRSFAAETWSKKPYEEFVIPKSITRLCHILHHYQNFGYQPIQRTSLPILQQHYP